MSPRRAAYLALAIAVLGGAWALLARGGAGGAETVPVTRRDLPVTVEAPGELDAVRSSLIGPPLVPDTWNFKIAFLAPESSQVRKGQPILGFDDAGLRDELQKRQTEFDVAVKDLEKKQAEVALAVKELEMQRSEADSRLEKARLKADRPEELSGLLDLQLARLDRDLAEKEVASLEARIEGHRLAGEADLESLAEKRDRAAARIRELEASIERMRVKAPQDGIVVYVTNWQGEKKKVGDQVWGQERVLKIPDLSEMVGRVEVDEPDAGRLAIGQSVAVRLDALPDEEFPGRIVQIGRVVKQKSRDNPRKIYTVDVALDRTDPLRMRPGMRLAASIEVDRAVGALVASRDAIFPRASGPVVFVKRGGGFEEHAVRLGRMNARFAEILDGAAEGDLLARRDLSGGGAAPGAAGDLSTAGVGP